MAGLRRKLVHVKNYLRDEGPLRNVLLELRTMPAAWTNLIKARNRSLHEIAKWAELQTVPLCSFLADMGKQEVDFNSALGDYLAGYIKFTQFWEDILRCRRALNQTREALKKAKDKEEQAKKKLKEAERKDGKKSPKPVEKADSDVSVTSSKSPRLERHKSSLEAARDTLARLEEDVQELTAEEEALTISTQQEIHDKLRRAYYVLATSRMELFHHLSLLQETILTSVANLNQVSGLGEQEGDFAYAPFGEPVGPHIYQHWHHGNELKKNLEIEREAARAALESERNRRQRDLLASQEQHEKVLEDLRQQFQVNKSELDATLSSVKADSAQHAALLEEQLHKYASENAVVKQQLVTLQEGVLRLLLDQAKGGILEASEASRENPSALLLKRIGTLQELLPQLTQEMSSKTDFVLVSGAFGRAVTTTVLAAMALAPALTLEVSQKLLAEINHLTEASTVFMNCCCEKFSAQPSANVGAESKLEASLQRLADLATTLTINEDLSSDESKAMTSAQQAITDALSLIAKMREDTKKLYTDHQLEINLELLDRAEKMITHARDVIDASTVLRKKIKTEGGSNAETALKLRKWSLGFNHAVDAVVDGTPLMLECMRQVLNGKGRFEELQVATKQISACSAQLMASLRASQQSKAEKTVIESETDHLIMTSHSVLTATRQVQNYHISKEVLQNDIGSLNATQMQALLMSTKVQVLKLEADLEKERAKLRKLQKMCYGDSKGTSDDETDETDT
eukprot:m.198726 g.198726  ORF g.198726 m.198726 type:complete len:745 (-) comp25896_c1_seq7:72-2306(-)